jgi:hypothetical protein
MFGVAEVTAGDSARKCPRCTEGRVLTDAWRAWWDAYAAAEAQYRAEHPDGYWPTSPAFWELDAQAPPQPETVPCASCWGGER